MIKKAFFFCLITFTSTSFVFSIDKMDSKYQVNYGDSKAQVHVTEFLSLSCPHCLNFLKKDFPRFLYQYVGQETVKWSFHLDPIDRLTYQVVVCLEQLDEMQKRSFFENITEFFYQEDCSSKRELYLMNLASYFDLNTHELSSSDYLKNCGVYEPAYSFLSQKSLISSPSVEINNFYYKEFPTPKFIEGKIKENLLKRSKL